MLFGRLKYVAPVLALTLVSCGDEAFDRARQGVRPGQQLHELIDASVGVYLEEQGAKTFSGVRSDHAVQCRPTGQPESWLSGQHPAVSIQSTSEGFFLFLSLWDPDCLTYGCRETVQSYGPVTREELVSSISDAGCVLSEGMEFRLESGAHLFPPMTYDHFLVQFDHQGRVEGVIDGG